MVRVAFSLLLFISLSTAATKEVRVTRSHFWHRLSTSADIGTEGLGYLGLVDMRYNVSLEKRLHGAVVSASPIDLWRADLIAAAQWKHRLSQSLSFKTTVAYRPWLQSSTVVDGARFWRHSMEARAELFHKPKKIRFHYRLIGWFHFPDDENSLYCSELFLRPLVGASLPLSAKLSLYLEEELFLKVTAGESDRDGTELLNKQMLWVGAAYRVSPKLLLKLQYINAITRFAETEILSQRSLDHYVSLHVHITPRVRK